MTTKKTLKKSPYNKIKNRPCANRDGIHIRRYAIEIHEYCIIFGAVTQAEHQFVRWLLFLYKF
nr:MAG TPA: hypothetical protein [Caudoviricetes sp.]